MSGLVAAGGHRLALEDLDVALAAEPEVLVIGTGASGRMAVPDAVADAVRRRGVELIAQSTAEAVDTFQRMQEHRRTAAGFHLRRLEASRRLTC